MNAIVIDNTIIPTKEDDIRNLDTYTLVCYKYMLSIEYLYRLNIYNQQRQKYKAYGLHLASSTNNIINELPVDISKNIIQYI
jgi:hypothetical protein